MEYLKLTIEKAQEDYKNGDPDIKAFLINLYGAEHFLTDIKDRVNSYESACKILNITPRSITDFSFMGEKQAKKWFSRLKIVTGIKAINEGWAPDFENESQRKWYNYFTNKNRSFSSASYYYYAYSSSGSDEYIESQEKANVIAKVFKEEYITYLF